jgi:hypothetical protein
MIFLKRDRTGSGKRFSKETTAASLANVVAAVFSVEFFVLVFVYVPPFFRGRSPNFLAGGPPFFWGDIPILFDGISPHFLGRSDFIGNFDDIVENRLDIHNVGDRKAGSGFDMAKLTGDQTLAAQIVDGVLDLIFRKTEDVRVFLVGFLEFIGLEFLLNADHIAGMFVAGHHRRVPIDDIRQKDDCHHVGFTGSG